MKNLIKAVLMICALTAGVSAPSHAALQKTDWKIMGDKQATLDTDTGLEWTVASGTAGSYAGALASLSSTYAGWRLPTWAEVQTLVEHIVGPGRFNKPGVGAGASYVTSLTSQQLSDWTTYIGGEPFAMSDQGYLYVVGKWAGTFEVYTPATPGGYSPYTSYQGVYLVNDGGVTLSSINNPTLNVNNPSAPINQPPSGTISLVSLLAGTNYADATLAYTPSGVSGFSGFEYKINGGPKQSTTGNVISLTGLSAGTTYTLEYAAYNNGGTGSWYTTTVTTQTPPPAAVSAPWVILVSALMLVMGVRRRVA